MSRMVLNYHVLSDNPDRLVLDVDYDEGKMTIVGNKKTLSLESKGDLPYSHFDREKIESIVLDSMLRKKRLPKTFWIPLGQKKAFSNDGLTRDYAGKHLNPNIMISSKGISFLHENSTIAKVKVFPMYVGVIP